MEGVNNMLLDNIFTSIFINKKDKNSSDI